MLGAVCEREREGKRGERRQRERERGGGGAKSIRQVSSPHTEKNGGHWPSELVKVNIIRAHERTGEPARHTPRFSRGNIDMAQ